MKRVVQVKLLPTREQYNALAGTLELCNRLADIVSDYAHGTGVKDKRYLQMAMYLELKNSGLSAQPAIHVIKKVSDAYKTLKSNLRNGNYGKPSSERYQKIVGKPISFRRNAAQPFDDRCLSWQMDDQTVSIWTTRGRLKGIRFVGDLDHIELLKRYRKGESDLIERDGIFYLIATLDEEAPEPITPIGVIGVDLGIVNIAVTSDNEMSTGTKVNKARERYLLVRKELQKKGTKSAKRRLKARRRKESRFARDVNHQISKRIVAEAERTVRGISLEELTGIQGRVRLRKPQRAKFHSWSFRQLGAFIGYKAERAGIPVVFVDPAYTSQMCSQCGHVDKRNRPNQETFQCKKCGVSLHADYNAAMNIAFLGHSQLSRDAA